MKIAKNIKNISKRILESEDNWKALYMGVWGYSRQIERDCRDNWEERRKFPLPASKNKYHIYTPKRLHAILTSKDGEFTLGHLQTLFSLFEELIKETAISLGKRPPTTWKERGIFLMETINIITKPENQELLLAVETRNCFIHNDSRVSKGWLRAHKGARGISAVSLGDSIKKGFPNIFHQIEGWNIFIVDITQKIQKKITDK